MGGAYLFSPFSRVLRKGKPLPIGQPPPGVEQLLAERKGWHGPYTEGDGPLPLLYQMYENFVADDEIRLREDIRYFWGEEWAVADIPDPRDPDPERYAILAAITGMLVLAFNYKIGLGIPRDGPSMIRGRAHLRQLQAQPKKWEKEPGWAKRVKPLKKRLVLPTAKGRLPEDEKQACAPLLKKNIFAWEPRIYFL
ncbi:MAG: hypothetical protein Q9165_006959 [Trypethelium subeluteriae]